jgi:uncharacterized protein
MKQSWLQNDRVIPKVCNTLENCVQKYDVEIKSIVLYGSRARGEVSSRTEYELLVLINDSIETDNYIKLSNSIKIDLLKQKLIYVNISIYTCKSFEDLLYNDELVGTFLYIILRENIVIFDKQGTFLSIREKISINNIKSEETFLEQCIKFAREMGSVKWEQKWEKVLMQYRYLKNRRNI